MAATKKNTKKKSDLEKLADKLAFKKKSAWDGINAKEKKAMFDLAEGFKSFLDSNKTEREAINTITKLAAKQGFVDIQKAKKNQKKLLKWTIYTIYLNKYFIYHMPLR